jgi:argininosuccinate synthase
MLVMAMKDDDVHVWGDGSTFKGNDIERFYRYDRLRIPRFASTSPGWIRRLLTNSAGARKCPSICSVPGSLYKMSTEKAY